MTLGSLTARRIDEIRRKHRWAWVTLPVLNGRQRYRLHDIDVRSIDDDDRVNITIEEESRWLRTERVPLRTKVELP